MKKTKQNTKLKEKHKNNNNKKKRMCCTLKNK